MLVVGPPTVRAMVESAGFPFRAGGEPSEEQVAAIRERLPVAPAAEAEAATGETDSAEVGAEGDGAQPAVEAETAAAVVCAQP